MDNGAVSALCLSRSLSGSCRRSICGRDCSIGREDRGGTSICQNVVDISVAVLTIGAPPNGAVYIGRVGCDRSGGQGGRHRAPITGPMICDTGGTGF